MLVSPQCEREPMRARVNLTTTHKFERKEPEQFPVYKYKYVYVDNYVIYKAKKNQSSSKKQKNTRIEEKKN